MNRQQISEAVDEINVETSSLNRRRFLGQMGLSGLATGVTLGMSGHNILHAANSKRPAKPNFVILLADDLGWQDIGCYDIDEGAPFETPNMDRLAKEGIRFTQGYSPAPTCAPSRVAMIGGQHPARTGRTHVYGGRPPKPWNSDHFRLIPPFYTARLEESATTIPEALKPLGYKSIHVGKWHISYNHNSFPHAKDQGFDYGSRDLGVSRRMPDRLNGFATSEDGDKYKLDENGFAYDKLTEDCIGFMDKAKSNPFFAFYSAFLVHTPIQTRNQRLLKKYCDKLGIEYPPPAGVWNKEKNDGEGQRNPYYCAMVEEFDYYIGRVINYLKKTPDPRWQGHQLIENTYILLSSDNGGCETAGPEIITDNYPLHKGKKYGYEGGIRVPMIISGPDLAQNKVSDVMINQLDFYPTFLKLAGEDPYSAKYSELQLDGCDISTLLYQDPGNGSLVKDKSGKVRQWMYWHFPHGQGQHSMIRAKGWKLVKNYDSVDNPAKQPFELYKLYDGKGKRVDIEEKKNIANEYPEITDKLKKILERQLDEVGALYPHYNPKFKRKLKNKELVPTVSRHAKKGNVAQVYYQENGARVVKANFIYTLKGGVKHNEEWFQLEAKLNSGKKMAECEIPEKATHYLFNLIDENNFLVSSVDVKDSVRQKMSTTTAHLAIENK